MKRFFLISLFVLAIIMPNNAQENTDSEQNKLYQYCLVTVKFPKNNNYITYLRIDYGYGGEEDLVDEKGEKILFNGWMSCINYMTLNGWEYYRNEIDSGKYLFRRIVTKEEAPRIIEKMKKKE